jgi:hypothetical protein
MRRMTSSSSPRDFAQDFDQWRRAVDNIVEARAGLSLDDLPDCPLMDWFEDGTSAKRAAARAIRNAKGGE